MQKNNSRRQTLGSVSVNSHGTNRRKSVGPNNSGGPGNTKYRPPRSRASMIPRVGRENLISPTPPPGSAKKTTSTGRNRRSSGIGGDRRQSIVSVPSPAKTDPRPITDKSFQQECIKKLLDFLLTRGYEHPISHRSLARPSGKDFSNIVTFMLRLVDPNFQDGTMKIEDEISLNFKAMGYPFPVSKTALVAAGSPHTWPSLLAALTWLMERIQCLDACILENEEDPGHFESLEDLENKTDKAFFQYLSKAYTAFLRGDEELTEHLENSLADRFECDDAIIEQEIEQMTDKNAVILEQINNLTFGEKDLQNYLEKKEGYTTDLEQFHDLIRQMDQHVDTLCQKKRDRAHELEDVNRKLSRTTTRVEDLKRSIGSQSLSLEDVQKMQNELKGVDEAIERAAVSKEEYRKSLWESGSEVKNLVAELESVVNIYNCQLGELMLNYDKIKNEGMIVINNDALVESGYFKILGVDLENTAQSSLQAGKQDYAEKIAEVKRNYQVALDEVERSEEVFADALERLKIIEEKIEKHEAMLSAERETQEAKLEVRVREADSMETKIASLRNPVALEEQIAQFERQCTELEALRMKNEKENVTRKKITFGEVVLACDAIKEYDGFCHEKVLEVQFYQKERESTTGGLKVSKLL